MTKINISIPDDFLKEIDKYKRIKKVTRSQFLVDAAKNYFNLIEDSIASKRKRDAIKSLKKTRKEIMELTADKGEIDVVKALRDMRNKRTLEVEKRVSGN